MVDKDCWEPRHPQEFVRAINDNKVLPFVRPDSDDELTYSPTLGLINSLGNGTLTGKYSQRANPAGTFNVITVTVMATMGSTTTFTAGTWTISFPVANGASAVDGSAEAFIANRVFRGRVPLAASGTTANVTTVGFGPQGLWSDVVPATFATGDRLIITIRYGTNT